jgi:hypothetical protein
LQTARVTLPAEFEACHVMSSAHDQ